MSCRWLDGLSPSQRRFGARAGIDEVFGQRDSLVPIGRAVVANEVRAGGAAGTVAQLDDFFEDVRVQRDGSEWNGAAENVAARSVVAAGSGVIDVSCCQAEGRITFAGPSLGDGPLEAKLLPIAARIDVE